MNPLSTHWGSHQTTLSVNLNKVALLRNARNLELPSVLHAGALVLQAGAQGITVHPRPDERHIRASDVDALAKLLGDWPGVEFNLEGNPFHQLMPLARSLVARGLALHQCTLVPDAQAQSTSDHGWDLTQDGAALAPLVAQLQALGVRVSLFMDPVPQAMAQAQAVGADRVELYTEAYARAHGGADQAQVLANYVASAQVARQLGLGVNAGHDLSRDNLTDFLRAVPGVQEVSIGHALVSDALELGLAGAVREYLLCIHQADQKGDKT
jgi:pyridoxine 5-phosphate synthase